MQAQQSILKFTESERPLGERLLKIAVETDRVEGYSEPHAVLIARYSGAIGAEMGLHGSDLTALKFAALSHDLGERAMKRNYMLRPEALTWEEKLDLWRHPILGEQAAGEIKLSRHTQLLIRWHHEWWNGLGYPDGLSYEGIPLGARILRVIDSYCALISTRPYRPPIDEEEARQIIADQAGIEFDPQVVQAFLALLADERTERETRARAEAQPPAQLSPEMGILTILTPEGLQTAYVPGDPQPPALEPAQPPSHQAEDYESHPTQTQNRLPETTPEHIEPDDVEDTENYMNQTDQDDSPSPTVEIFEAPDDIFPAGPAAVTPRDPSQNHD